MAPGDDTHKNSSLEQRVLSVEEELAAIKARNSKVEGHKAWELSKTRRLLIAGVTYVVAVLVLKVIGADSYALAALVPALAYLLSTLSLPAIKNWWLRSIWGLGK